MFEGFTTDIKNQIKTNINGTVNGCSINSKQPLNAIVKIRVSDRRISDVQHIDVDIRKLCNSKIVYQIITPNY